MSTTNHPCPYCGDELDYEAELGPGGLYGVEVFFYWCDSCGWHSGEKPPKGANKSVARRTVLSSPIA